MISSINWTRQLPGLRGSVLKPPFLWSEASQARSGCRTCLLSEHRAEPWAEAGPIDEILNLFLESPSCALASERSADCAHSAFDVVSRETH